MTVLPEAASVRFEILGPLRAWREDTELDLGPGKQRAVLAVLLLNANRPTPTARIVDGQAEGSVRAGDPVTMARALLLAAHGFVLSGHTMIDDDVTEEALDAELAHLVRRAVAP